MSLKRNTTTIAVAAIGAVGIAAAALLLRRKFAKSAQEPEAKGASRISHLPSAFVIRAAAEEDIDELYKIINWAYRGKPLSEWTTKPAELKEGEKKSGWTGEQHLVEGDRIARDGLRKILANGEQQAVLVLVDNEAKLKAEKEAADAKTTVPSSRRFLVGCIKVDKVSATNCDVGMFAVDPERQGGGMGKMLLQAAESLARSKFGATVAEMHVVHCREDIQKFYKKHGYVLTGQTAPFPQEDAGNGRPRETVKVPLHFICMEKKLV